ncbi:hypothetical protein ACIBSW_16470 [Actinoplanes sp. NPDC049668]|uniref:hypothetical protein n=1 Tax=unclassified Actinoplanes TaxID=2626549 RepID=UPI0033B93AC4
MELHRDTGKVLRIAILITAGGALLLAMPALLNLIGREFVLGPWLAYGIGAVLALVGVGQIYSTLRHPFRLVAGDSTLIVRSSVLKADIPWESLAAVTLERLHYLDPPAAPHLVLWPAPGVDLGTKPNYRRKGEDRAGYPVIQLDELRESPAEVVAVLQRFAGARFTA